MDKEVFLGVVKTFAVKELPDSEVEFSGEIPTSVVDAYKIKALEHLKENLELPGFRKGHVPSEVVVKKLGEMRILEEAVQLSLRDFYPILITEMHIDAVGQPEVRITKISPQNPVGLTIVTAVYPHVELPKNWESVGENISLIEPDVATEKEVEDTLLSLQKNRAVKNEGVPDELPELTDEFARSLGAFESLENLKAQITKGINEEKRRQARDVRRGKIIDALIEKTPINLPTLFVESELEKIIAQMKDGVSRVHMTLEEYLSRINKNEEGIRKEFREQAAKRARIQLILNTIAEAKKIEVEESLINQEVEFALKQFPNAKPELLRIHIETLMRNDKVLQLLESSSKKE